MRRLTWMAVGVVAGTAGRRWLAGRIRRSIAANGVGAGSARDAGGPAGTRAASGTAGTGTVRALVEAAGPVAEVTGTAGAAAGRGVARLAGLGARRVRVRVRHAVDGGRADARAREDELRRAWGRPSRPGGPGRAAGPAAAGLRPHGRRPTAR